ncbi:hypothetical protein BHE74_00009299 [Ensete ventricosum]|nr:hypothetical protein BHE74_00009299 [Ensete ventricosum]RZR77140.1 hypothetical protein BHM03_00002129 [Ensete ventricosum]
MFWLQLPHALCHMLERSANKSQQGVPKPSISESESALLNRIASREKSAGMVTSEAVVVAANMVRTDKSLSGTHLLCAVGRYQESCSQVCSPRI